jgi:hypothetical protein
VAQFAEIQRAKNLYRDTLMAKPNVVGLGTAYKVVAGKTTEELCLVTLVEKKQSYTSLSAKEAIPPSVNGISTDVIEVGRLHALATPCDRWRPIPGGVSIGHYKITAGTFACVVRDRRTKSRLILSNNHVLADSNNALIGDAILQPGEVDGGKLDQDTGAGLARFVEVKYGSQPELPAWKKSLITFLKGLGLDNLAALLGFVAETYNQVDAAVARPTSDDLILDAIQEIGTVGGTVPATLGLAVRKSGRSTGLTKGTVIILDSTVTIDYDGGNSARFDNQIITTNMSQPGDSGSLLVSAQEPKAVGLLFAGSDQVTIFNPIQLVLDSLEVDL